MEALVAAVKVGDVPALKLYFSIVTPPQKAAFPLIPIDLDSQPPGEILAALKRLLASGSISIDHYGAVLDSLLKTAQVETSISLAARVIDTEPLDMAKAITATAAQCGDLEMAQGALAKVLQYSVARPQPEAPEPTATVSNEPDPTYGMTDDEKLAHWQSELDQYRDG